MSLTGNKDTDTLILFQLSDKELGMVCSVNKYVKKLCSDPSFWRKKLIQRFKLSENELHFLEKYLGDPKELYIFLTTKIKIGNKMAEISNILSVVKDPKIIEEIESIIQKIIPDEFPTWINKSIFMYEIRKNLLIKLFLYKNNNYTFLYTNQFWNMFNIWKKINPIGEIELSDYLANKINYTNINFSSNSLFPTIPKI
jgi:hypothetical protein